MPVLHVIMKDGERRIPFAPGLSVREILDTTNIVMRSAGGVFGACGLCLIHIEAGAGSKPTANELINLPPDRIHREIPLACQLRPLQDIRITIAAPARTTNWRSIDADEYSSTAVLPPAVPAVKQDGPSYGVAVDLGTTQIRLSLWDLEQGRRLAGRSGLNPQARFGADVLTRLSVAAESEARSQEISRLAREAIGEALQEISTTEYVNLREIRHLVIVGNTSMLALLSGRNFNFISDLMAGVLATQAKEPI